jgi:hypothetical protein
MGAGAILPSHTTKLPFGLIATNSVAIFLNRLFFAGFAGNDCREPTG